MEKLDDVAKDPAVVDVNLVISAVVVDEEVLLRVYVNRAHDALLKQKDIAL